MTDTSSTSPATVQEAVDQLLATMSHRDKDVLRAILGEKLIAGCHFTLGLAIRNRFGLHAGNMALLRASAREQARHGRAQGDASGPEELSELDILLMGADGASSVIVRALWDRLQADALRASSPERPKGAGADALRAARAERAKRAGLSAQRARGRTPGADWLPLPGPRGLGLASTALREPQFVIEHARTQIGPQQATLDLAGLHARVPRSWASAERSQCSVGNRWATAQTTRRPARYIQPCGR